MAKDLLTQTMTTLSAELAFCESGRVISKYRSRLVLDAVKISMCMENLNHQEERLI